MQHVPRTPLAGLLDLTIEVLLFPPRKQLRFPLRQIRLHREIGLRQIECGFVIHGNSGEAHWFASSVLVVNWNARNRNITEHTGMCVEVLVRYADVLAGNRQNRLPRARSQREGPRRSLEVLGAYVMQRDEGTDGRNRRPEACLSSGSARAASRLMPANSPPSCGPGRSWPTACRLPARQCG